MKDGRNDKTGAIGDDAYTREIEANWKVEKTAFFRSDYHRQLAFGLGAHCGNYDGTITINPAIGQEEYQCAFCYHRVVVDCLCKTCGAAPVHDDEGKVESCPAAAFDEGFEKDFAAAGDKAYRMYVARHEERQVAKAKLDLVDLNPDPDDLAPGETDDASGSAQARRLKPGDLFASETITGRPLLNATKTTLIKRFNIAKKDCMTVALVLVGIPLFTGENENENLSWFCPTLVHGLLFCRKFAMTSNWCGITECVDSGILMLPIVRRSRTT